MQQTAPLASLTPPAIESISPTIITEGDLTLSLTIQGVNYTEESVVYFGGQPVPAQRASETELQAVIDAGLISQVGTYPITVRNPKPMQRPEWGDGTSNPAHLIVNYRY